MVFKTKICKITLMPLLALAAIIFTISLSSCAPGEYSQTLKDPQVKTPDILQTGTLKVGVDFGNPPLAGETSKSAGIDIDVASAVGDELGLKVEFVDVGTSPELTLANKKCDIVMGISKASNISELNKTDPYIETACALFSKSANAPIPTKEGNDKISAQMASNSALAAQAQFNVANIKLEDNLSKCFETLEKGQVKYVAADAVIGAYNVKNTESDAQIIALLTKPSGYCIGIPTSNKNLSEKVNGALETLKKGGVLEVIEKKWLGRALNLGSIKLTPEAGNQVDAGEFENGVYSQTGGPNTSKKNDEALSTESGQTSVTPVPSD